MRLLVSTRQLAASVAAIAAGMGFTIADEPIAALTCGVLFAVCFDSLLQRIGNVERGGPPHSGR